MRRSLLTSLVLVMCIGPGSLALFAEGNEPADKVTDSRATPASAVSRSEVEQLRQQLAEQQQTIEQLKAIVQRLATVQAAGDAQAVSDDTVVDGHVVNASVVQSPRQGDDLLDVSQTKKTTKPGDIPLSAGWNGEHFFIRSPDGTFQIQPYGYINADYRAYNGDGAPSNTFLLRRARFGFQGNYGTHFQFALLTDAAATSGSIVRDVYVNAVISHPFQIQAGQFKEPFAQETAVGATNTDFVDRGLQALLYPAASSAYRSPGAVIHGDLASNRIQYWAGGFNSHGYVVSATTNQPEVIGRLRFYPWRHEKDSALQGLAFGGSIGYGRTSGLANERSYNATLPDAAYIFFPVFPVNGATERYNGEFTYLKGPWALRGEYDTLSYARNNIGILQFGGLGFISAPEIRSRGWNIATTYLLTGEKRPENGTPRVKHPWMGPETPGGGRPGLGAWEVAFRYSGVHSNEPGISYLNFFTPENIPTFNYHTDQFTAGLNWYPNYWIRYTANFNIDRLHEPSTIGVLPGNYFVFLQRLQFRF